MTEMSNRPLRHYAAAALVGVFVTAATFGVAFVVSETAPSHGAARLLGVLGAIGLALTVYGLMGIARSPQRVRLLGGIARTPSLVRFLVRFAVVIVGAIGLCALVHVLCYSRVSEIRAACRAAYGSEFGGGTLASRKQSLEQAEQQMASTLGGVALRIESIVYGSFAIDLCNAARTDLERIGRGQCPQRLLDGLSCRCGAQTWPSGKGNCARPACHYGGLDGPDGFYCEGPEGVTPWRALNP